MQPLAGWLLGAPQNAVLGLAAAMMLPLAPIWSGAVLALLVLSRGPVRAVAYGAIAIAGLVLLALLFGKPPAQVLANSTGTWLPVLFMAVMLRTWRSVTLAAQVAVLLGALGIIGIYLSVGDPVMFWKQVLTEIAPVFEAMGLQEQADALVTRQDEIAPQMTVLVVFTSWSMAIAVLMLGYALLQAVPENKGLYGRFSDLNLGRVVAGVMAVASMTAVATSSAWLQDVAFFMFAVFWFQGLALIHWLHGSGRITVGVVVVTYVMLPILNVLLVIALAVAGYADAWFDYRRRLRKQN